MKTSKIIFFLLLAVLGFSSFSSQAKAQSVSVNFSTFYNDLNPYGRWIDNPRYGQVWAYDEPGFRPYYTKGHWEYTDYGWAWASDYEWGWAPFHYGRWEEDPYYGWIWIPGYEWASAWVEWSEADDYYGWAPLGYGVDINISFGSIPRNRWVYIPRQHIYNSNLYDYCVFPGRNNNYFNNSRIINNIYNGRGARYMTGPNRADVERYSNNRIETRRIEYGRPQNAGNNWGRNRNEVAGQNERNNGQNRIDNNRRVDNNISQPRRNEVQPQNNGAQQREGQFRQNRVTNGSEQNANNFPRTRQRQENNAGNSGQGQNNFPRQRQNIPQQTSPQQNFPQQNSDGQNMRNHRGFDQRTNNERVPAQQQRVDNNQSQQRNFGGGQNGGRQSERQSNGGSGNQGRSGHQGGRRG